MSEAQEETKEQKIILESWSPKSVLLVTILVATVLAGLFLLVGLVQKLSFLLFLVVIAIFLAYLLDPLVNAIRKPFEVRQIEKMMPRPLAILITYILVCALLFLVLSYVFPLINDEIEDFVSNIPSYSGQIEMRARDTLTLIEKRLFPMNCKRRLALTLADW